nr:hypothetical protein [uncultured Massilia sp.]
MHLTVRIAAALGPILAASLACTPAHAGPWVAIPPQSLQIVPGSALDLSALHLSALAGDADAARPAGADGPVRVGAQGKFVFANKPDRPVRFLAASWGVSPASGSFPDAAAGKRVARQLRLAGYNLVRLHMVDAVLMTGGGAHMTFNPVQLDRMYAFLAALKKEGLYWMFDGLSNKNGGYSNAVAGKGKGQWAPSPYDVKAGVYVSDAEREHFRQLTRKLFTPVNPYTGLSIAADPALAGIILVNEGGIDFSVLTFGSPTVRASLGAAFNGWLKTRYGASTALQKAWSEGGADRFDPGAESLEQGTVRLPVDIHKASPRNIDAQKFILAREAETARWMTAHFRAPASAGGIGYGGPLTSLNNWLSLQANLSRAQFSWIDMHAYFDDPSKFAEPGSTIRQASSFHDTGLTPDARDAGRRSLGYVQSLAANRHAGKPFTVSEYGHVFWSAWRREAVAVAAYAGLQDWDMICQFNEPVILDGADDAAVPQRHRAIYPYHIGLDPVAKATETLAALLFLRGDVAPSPNAVVVRIGTDDFGGANNSMGSAGGLRYALAGLALQTRLGVAVDDGAGPAALPGAWKTPRKTIAPTGKENPAQVTSELSAAGVLPRTGLTDVANAVYASDTRELVLRGRERSLAIATPRTEAAVFDATVPPGLAHLHIERFDTPAMVALSSLDGRPLADAGRMLLTVSTDAINSGMTFQVTNPDGSRSVKQGELASVDERKVLQDIGHLPVLLQSTRMRLGIVNANYRSLAVYALALNGERMGRLEQVDAKDGTLFVDIDTQRYPTTYFEIVAVRQNK